MSPKRSKLPGLEPKIHTTHGQGLKKSEVKVSVTSPEGREKTILQAEDLRYVKDRRKRPSKLWYTLVTFTRYPKLSVQLRQRITDGALGLRVMGGNHYLAHILTPEERLKTLAGLTPLQFFGKPSNKSNPSRDDTITQYFRESFKDRRRRAVESYRKHKAKKNQYGRRVGRKR